MNRKDLRWIEEVRRTHVPLHERPPGEPYQPAYLWGDPRFVRPRPTTFWKRLLDDLGF
ncbi:MAG TPA: hypothetical protein VJ547_07395 [Candidatus Thermoplasmatota archaeon]|nr:hypothetical protein [Candidatus Thermoplasmatota archaeon]